MANDERSATRFMSDSSIRVNPSMEEPSNWISPSRALLNWDRGTSTFLMMPRMSVNWSLMNRTFSVSQAFLISALLRPGPAASNFNTFAFAAFAITPSGGWDDRRFAQDRRDSSSIPQECKRFLRAEMRNMQDLHILLRTAGARTGLSVAPVQRRKGSSRRKTGSRAPFAR